MAPSSRKRRADADGSSGVAHGQIFRIILSPAKTLDLKTKLTRDVPIPWTKPSCDVGKTRAVAVAIKGYLATKPGKAAFAKMLGLTSANLIKTSTEYWNDFQPPAADSDDATATNDAIVDLASLPKSARPCSYAYSGPAFQGLGMSTIQDDEAIKYLQARLRVLDAVYGWLRPMDVIQPYRLEMATKKVFENCHDFDTGEGNSAITKSTSLVEFWKPAISHQIGLEQQHKNDAGTKGKAKHAPANFFLVNLASEEYSAVIDMNFLSNYNIQMVKVVFRTAGRVVSVHAKRARGLMARYLAINQVDTLNGIRSFCDEGYECKTDLESMDGSGPIELVFDRVKDWGSAVSSKETSAGDKTTHPKRIRAKR